MQSTLPKESIPRIQYTQEQMHYSIDCSNKTQIVIKIDDLHNHKQLMIVVTNPMLEGHFMTIDHLSKEITKQSVHQGRGKKQLLTHNGNILTLSFTYPKCQTKKVSFQCEWRHTQESDPNLKLLLKIAKDMKASYRCSLEKWQAHVEKAIKQIEVKFNALDLQMKRKVMEFQKRCDILLGSCQSESKLRMEKQRQILIDSNKRYFDEFKVIKKDLQTSLADKHAQSVQFINQEIQRIEDLMFKDQSEAKERFGEIKLELKDLIANMDQTFKEIRTQIAEMQKKQPKYEKENIIISSSEALTTSISLSSRKSLERSSGKQETIQTTIKEESIQKSSSEENGEQRQPISHFDNL